MPAHRLIGLAAAAGALALASPGAASAKLTAKASVKTTGGLTRLVVSLSSPRKLGSAARPTSVKVRVSRKRSYALARARGSAAAAAVSYGTWRSAGVKGAAAKPIVALAGTKITVLVGTRAGTVTLRPSVPKLGGGTGTPGTGTPGTGTPGAPLFAPPGRGLTGAEALKSIAPYIVNSRFTSCVPGWPSCSVEERYSFCPNGLNARYRLLTPTAGSDRDAAGTVQPVGADQKADGSWAISLQFTGGAVSYYTWRVTTEGVVTGQYWRPGLDPATDAPSELIGPLQYARGYYAGLYGQDDC